MIRQAWSPPKRDTLCRIVSSLSHVRLFATPWTVAHQALPSTGFSRQEYWSGLPFPSPGELPDPGIEPWSPTLQAGALPSEPPGSLCHFTSYKLLLFLEKQREDSSTQNNWQHIYLCPATHLLSVVEGGGVGTVWQETYPCVLAKETDGKAQCCGPS